MTHDDALYFRPRIVEVVEDTAQQKTTTISDGTVATDFKTAGLDSKTFGGHDRQPGEPTGQLRDERSIVDTDGRRRWAFATNYTGGRL